MIYKTCSVAILKAPLYQPGSLNAFPNQTEFPLLQLSKTFCQPGLIL
jgi:hypothetical protein